MRPTNSLLSSNVSNSASFNSGYAWATDIVRASFQVVVSSGSCVGTFVLQASDDNLGGNPVARPTPTNWSTIASTTTIVASTTAIGSNSVFLFPYIECSYEYLRVKFTDGSGGSANGVTSINIKTLSL